MKKAFVLLILLAIMVTALVGCEEDHNDGKCDICGKNATYSDGSEEYCEKHLWDAVKWYIEQGQD